jgi:hypothetical protein
VHGHLRGTFSGLGSDRLSADPRHVRGVESFDESPSLVPITLERVPARVVSEELGHGLVGSVGVDAPEHAIDRERLREAVHLPPLGFTLLSRDVECGQTGVGEKGVRDRCVTVDELGSELERQRDPTVVMGQDTSADPVPGLEHENGPPMRTELARGFEAGRAGPHDDHVGPSHRDIP